MQEISFTLNGQHRTASIRSDECLLETLRTRCGVTSPKDGCQPQGQCGCCLALVNGVAKTTCATPAAKADGKEIVTLEGLPQNEREMIAKSFVTVAGLQCGFCIPGIALRAKSFLDKTPDPTRDQIARSLAGHLCRCTGYTK
ncbi:MAG: 2Fe-2S iron-sulfur cluster-binding protein, partial [Acidobacteriota bacterium]|nr:2Fe-2S iron-sulfur cluster-binding protein [Acidobacteriota bacterium]